MEKTSSEGDVSSSVDLAAGLDVVTVPVKPVESGVSTEAPAPSYSAEITAAVATISAEASAAVATISAEVSAAVASISLEASAAVASISAAANTSISPTRAEAPAVASTPVKSSAKARTRVQPVRSSATAAEAAWTQMPSTSAATQHSVPWTPDIAKTITASKSPKTIAASKTKKRSATSTTESPKPSTISSTESLFEDLTLGDGNQMEPPRASNFRFLSAPPMILIPNRVDYAFAPRERLPYPKLPIPINPVIPAECGKMPPLTSLTIGLKEGISNAFSIRWTMDIDITFAEIDVYQFFVYIDTSGGPNTRKWLTFGSEDALPLPMSATICDFERGIRYYISIRAIDVYGRVGPFGVPKMAYLER